MEKKLTTWFVTIFFFVWHGLIVFWFNNYNCVKTVANGCGGPKHHQEADICFVCCRFSQSMMLDLHNKYNDKIWLDFFCSLCVCVCVNIFRISCWPDFLFVAGNSFRNFFFNCFIARCIGVDCPTFENIFFLSSKSIMCFLSDFFRDWFR